MQTEQISKSQKSIGSIAAVTSRFDSSTAIWTDGLTKQFGALTAVDNVSFSIQHGEIFGYLGPNGCGKTTTIHLLLGLIPPDSGSSSVLGHDTRTDSQQIRELSGALLEHPGVYEQMTAFDNLEFYARAWRITSAARNSRIEELLGACGLWDRRFENVGNWSRGMKQQLALARVLLHRPSVVFLDEPTAGLDVVAANRVRKNIESIARNEGVTVFLTTHNLAEAERLCDRVAVVREGRLLSLSTPEELQRRSSTPTVYVSGSGFSADVVRQLESRADVAFVEAEENRLALTVSESVDQAAIVRMLVQSGANVEEVRQERATLEDAFLRTLEQKEDNNE